MFWVDEEIEKKKQISNPERKKVLNFWWASHGINKYLYHSKATLSSRSCADAKSAKIDKLTSYKIRLRHTPLYIDAKSAEIDQLVSIMMRY